MLPNREIPSRVKLVGQGRLAVSTLGKNPYVDANPRCANNPDMMIVKITGGMLRAARSLTRPAT